MADRFAAAGYSLYLVGGIVRDLWLDREPGPDVDLDLTTDALPDAILEHGLEGFSQPPCRARVSG